MLLQCACALLVRHPPAKHIYGALCRAAALSSLKRTSKQFRHIHADLTVRNSNLCFFIPANRLHPLLLFLPLLHSVLAIASEGIRFISGIVLKLS